MTGLKRKSRASMSDSSRVGFEKVGFRERKNDVKHRDATPRETILQEIQRTVKLKKTECASSAGLVAHDALVGMTSKLAVTGFARHALATVFGFPSGLSCRPTRRYRR